MNDFEEYDQFGTELFLPWMGASTVACVEKSDPILEIIRKKEKMQMTAYEQLQKLLPQLATSLKVSGDGLERLFERHCCFVQPPLTSTSGEIRAETGQAINLIEGVILAGRVLEKIDSGNFTDVDLEASVSSCLGKGQFDLGTGAFKGSVRSKSEACTALGDEPALAWLWLNLLRIALTFTSPKVKILWAVYPRGSEVCIILETVDYERATPRSKSQKKLVENRRKRLLDSSFESVISLCHLMVNAHNGVLHFESGANDGACFIARLPRSMPHSNLRKPG